MTPSPKKQDFYNLLNRAVHTDDPTVRKTKPSGGYSKKKTGQHKIANTSKKQSDKSRLKNA